MEKGFSLAETLVVVAVIAVLGIILVDLLFRTVKGGNKTQLIGLIKQNGQVALSSLDYAIRQADAVVCPSTANGSGNILVVVKGGLFTRYFFYSPSGQNGYLASDNPAPADPRYYNDQTKDSLGNIPLNLCTSGANGWPTDCTNSSGTKIACTPGTGANILTDQVNTSLVLGSGSFVRGKSAGAKDIIITSFSLAPPLNGSNAAENQVGVNNQIPFSTTTELR